MAEYHKVYIPPLPNTSQLTAEDRYWKQFKTVETHKHFSKVTDIKFSPVYPYDIAVAAATKVVIYDPLTLQPHKTLTRFKDPTLALSYRADSRLLAVSHDNTISLCDPNSRIILRTLKSHTLPVWGLEFSSHYSHIWSGSDDKNVKHWDVSSERCISTYSNHTDYVRIVKEDKENDKIVISASYDHSVRIWDTRTSTNDASSLLYTHSFPISALLQINPYTLAVAGDAYIHIIDTRNTNNPVHISNNHSKTVTSLCQDQTGTKILSSSLDAFVKVYDTNYKVISSIKYDLPLLVAAFSPSSNILATGSTDGTLLLKKNETKSISASLSHTSFTPTDSVTPTATSSDDYRVAHLRSVRLKPYDIYLKKFHYHMALDCVLKENVKPVIVCAVIDELIERQALEVALSNRNESTLLPICRFILTNITQPLYTSLLLDVTSLLISLYSSVLTTSPMLADFIMKLQNRVKEETSICREMMKIRGGIEGIWWGAQRIEGEKKRNSLERDANDEADINEEKSKIDNIHVSPVESEYKSMDDVDERFLNEIREEKENESDIHLETELVINNLKDKNVETERERTKKRKEKKKSRNSNV